MVLRQQPLAISRPQRKTKPRRTRYGDAIRDICKSVEPRRKSDIAEFLNAIFADFNMRVWPPR